jgi:hypothetical protein
VFGTDWPYDMALDWPVAWILAMESLSSEEKDAIPWKNLATLLDRLWATAVAAAPRGVLACGPW